MATKSEKEATGAEGLGFDLDVLETGDRASKGEWFTPIHPDTGEDLPMRFLVYGEDSPQYGRAMDAVQDWRLKQRRSKRRKSEDEVKFSEVREIATILACYLVGEWEGVLAGKKVLACNAPNRRMVFERHRWLADQVVEFSRDRGNFLPT